MAGEPGTVQSRQSESESESFERNDDAAPRGKGARTLFSEAVPVFPRVGRSSELVVPWFGDASESPGKKQPGTGKKRLGTDKKPGTDKKRQRNDSTNAGDAAATAATSAPSRQSVERNGGATATAVVPPALVETTNSPANQKKKWTYGCQHGRRRIRRKECGGSGICQHNR